MPGAIRAAGAQSAGASLAAAAATGASIPPCRFDRDVDVEVGRQPIAHPGEHGSLVDSIQALARPSVGFRARRSGVRPGLVRVALTGVAGAFARRRIDRAHFRQDLFDFRRADDGLVRAEKPLALLANGLLEIRHDLREVGIRFELPFRAIEVGAQRVVPDLVDLVRIAVQIDDNDFMHDYLPSWPIVLLMCFQ
jgi:hypothetical protein